MAQNKMVKSDIGRQKEIKERQETEKKLKDCGK
jgi:hypothetical protein